MPPLTRLVGQPSSAAYFSREAGPLQVVYAGKAHPRDESGKALIRSIYEAAVTLGDAVSIVYLEDYDMAQAKQICSGVDLWLNTPQRPHEASGTSGRSTDWTRRGIWNGDLRPG